MIHFVPRMLYFLKVAIFLWDIPIHGHTYGPTVAGQGVFYPNNHSQNAEFDQVFNGVYEFSYSITNGGCSLKDSL